MTGTGGGTTTVDAADEAGGEVVFSSDGLDPLPAVVRPPGLIQSGRSGASATTNKEGTDEAATSLDTSAQPSAADAFQIFCGHVYDPPMSDRSSGGGVSQQKQRQPSKESPAERLGRLKRELEDLEQELANSASSPSSDGTANPFSAAVRELTDRLARSKLPTQQELSEQMDAAAGNLSGAAPEVAETTTTSASSSSSAAAALEERLRRLEVYVGSQSVSAGNRSLASRVDVMETSLERLDDAKLTKLTHAAKVIRQDLEAAAKARTKLHASKQGADNVKRMQSLHEELEQLQGMSKHLPALCQRLQTLAAVHADATTWASRLASTERVVSQLEGQVQVLEKTASQLDAALTENAAALASNVKALDARLANVGRSEI